MKYIASAIIHLSGWRTEGEFPVIDKCVVIVGPHTSFWDFIWGRLFYLKMGYKASMLIKSKYFFWPLGAILRASGGIPVYYSTSGQFIKSVVEHFRKQEKMYLTITPEGTRKPVKRWKTGFYHIAQASQVPILMAWVDYGNKVMGIKGLFHPTGDIERDLHTIQRFYKAKWAKHPEKFYEINHSTPDHPGSSSTGDASTATVRDEA